MYEVKLILLAAVLSIACADNKWYEYEMECASMLGSVSHPCLKACILSRAGLTNENGIYDLDKALEKIDALDDKLGEKKYLLSSAVKICYREIAPMDTDNRCLAANAMYHCVGNMLRPGKLYRAMRKQRSTGLRSTDMESACKSSGKGGSKKSGGYKLG